MKKLLLTLILLLSLAAPGWGATYYVKNGGNNASDGLSDANAWATIAKVNATTLSGDDVVKFKRGSVWYETLTIGTSGTSGHPITFTDYDAGAKPIIHGGDVISDGSGGVGTWTDAGGGIWTQDFATCNGLLENNVSLPKASTTGITDGYWFADGVKIYYKPTAGDNPNSNGKPVCRFVRASSVDFTLATPISYNSFSNLKFIGGDGFYNGENRSVVGIVIDNCDFSHARNALGNLKAGNANSSITITNCTFDHCGANIYLLIAGNYKWTATITGNTFTYVNRTGFSAPSGAGNYDTVWYMAGPGRDAADRGAIELQNVTGSTISNNTIGGGYSVCDTDGGIVHWFNETSITRSTYRGNYIHDLEGPGFANGGVVDGGTIACDFIYNIVVNCGSGAGGPHGGLRLNRGQNTSAPSLIANNTIYGCDVGIYYYSLTNYYTVKNNICMNNTKASRCDTWGDHLVVDYNCYYPDGAAAFGYGPGSDMTFAQWKAQFVTLNWDINSFIADPLFANVGGSYALATDFKLQAGSPCINAGTDVGLTTDYFGNAVPQ